MREYTKKEALAQVLKNLLKGRQDALREELEFLESLGLEFHKKIILDRISQIKEELKDV